MVQDVHVIDASAVGLEIFNRGRSVTPARERENRHHITRSRDSRLAA
jgi:hypothetical protein